MESTTYIAHKVCSKCDESKELCCFGKQKASKDGLHPWCKGCAKEYNQKYYKANKSVLNEISRKNYVENRDHYKALNKKWYEENKDRHRAVSDAWMERNREKMNIWYQERMDSTRAWIRSLKSVPCMDCGEEFPTCVMEYDHVRGEKRHCIGKMANHNRNRVLEEIAKCELVCCNCHRIRTHQRRVKTTIPGVMRFRAWINQMKSDPCTDCGQRLSAVAMDFDHVHGEKVDQISNMTFHNRTKVLDELSKCQLVCANCHRMRTISRLHELKETSIAL